MLFVISDIRPLPKSPPFPVWPVNSVSYYVYNVCDHQECYAEVGSQAISYTTGVPAMIGAKMFLEGKWTEKGVHTCEEFDPDPFMAELNVQGLPWKESFDPVKVG